MSLTIHEMLKHALTQYVGEILKTEQIWSIVSTEYPELRDRKSSFQPNDHTGAWSCKLCEHPQSRIFQKINKAYYLVIDHNLETNLLDDIGNIQNCDEPETTKKRLIDARIGQGKFRTDLLKYWDEKCAVTGLNLIELLKASHIKPWAKCADNHEKLDKFNGLLLSPNLDCLFDRGLISFDAATGRIVISTLVIIEDYNMLGINTNQAINASKLTKRHQEYLQFHKENVFRRDEIN